MHTTIWWGYTTPHGNICQAFGVIFCHFFPFGDVCRILFADPIDSQANPWRELLRHADFILGLPRSKAHRMKMN